MSGRIYTAEFQNVAVTAQQDFFEINPASNKPIELHEFGLFQTSDVGDAAEEMLSCKVIRGHTTSGSGGTTQTAAPRKTAQTAVGATCELNNTTIASAGTAVDLLSFSFNVRVGYEKIWTPETRPGTINGTLLVIRLLTTPADSLTMDGYFTFEELA